MRYIVEKKVVSPGAKRVWAGKLPDNTLRLWRSVKHEKVLLRAYENASVARRLLVRYFAYYNRKRPRQNLAGKISDEVYYAEGSLLFRPPFCLVSTLQIDIGEAMADTATEAAPTQSFYFIRGVKEDTDEYKLPDDAEKVRQALGESMNARNVAFLLGAGCSSLRVDDKEVGVPTMAPLAQEFIKSCKTDDSSFPTTDERDLLSRQFGVDIDKYSHNLERLMELLFSLRFVLHQSSLANAEDQLQTINTVIRKVQNFLWTKCTRGAFAKGDNTVMALYESFYRKLVLRDRSLPRPWVFTTNYDLFNETAMDRLGLPYTNGFSGVIERRFNPATFRYALAEQLDLTTRKWSVVDAFVYLCKLHGSINWTEDEHGLYPIRENVDTGGSEKVMIYPTPAKQNATLGSPYADLFREFQSRIVREQSVLFTMGYAFGDEHINSIIYQALTIPTFRLVIFINPASQGELAKLRGLKDPRIWIIGSDKDQSGHNAHYFDMIVKQFMPQSPSERINDAIKEVSEVMAPKKKESNE